MTDPPLLTGRDHVAALIAALPELDTELLDGWGRNLAGVLVGGGRLLVAGNGGSAAQAQHLTSELVGRYRDDRPALSALALHAETSSLTAIANDYGYDQSFARQVRAHGRPGDVFLGMSTSGRSPNVVAATAAAREGGLLTWALTGPGPNAVAAAADVGLCVSAPTTATVQEVHQVALHLICAAVDVEVGAARPSSGYRADSDRTDSDRTDSDRTDSDRTDSDRTDSDRTLSDRRVSDRRVSDESVRDLSARTRAAQARAAREQVRP